MKREDKYCFVIIIVLTIIFLILTVIFNLIGVKEAIPYIYAIYLTFGFFILTYMANSIKNTYKSDKSNLYAFLSKTDILINFVSCFFSKYGTSQSIKNIASNIFKFSWIILLITCLLWIKYEKRQK